MRSKKDPAFRLWQRNYYENIVRNEKSLNLIRLYIEFNPLLWEQNLSFRNMELPSLDQVEKILQKFEKLL